MSCQEPSPPLQPTPAAESEVGSMQDVALAENHRAEEKLVIPVPEHLLDELRTAQEEQRELRERLFIVSSKIRIVKEKIYVSIKKGNAAAPGSSQGAKGSGLFEQDRRWLAERSADEEAPPADVRPMRSRKPAKRVQPKAAAKAAEGEPQKKARQYAPRDTPCVACWRRGQGMRQGAAKHTNCPDV